MAGTTRLELATSAVTVKRCRRTSFDTTRYRMSALIVPLLYPDLAGRSQKQVLDLPPETFVWFCTYHRRSTGRFRRGGRELRLTVIFLLRPRFLRTAPCNLLLGPLLCPDDLVLRNEVV